MEKEKKQLPQALKFILIVLALLLVLAFLALAVIILNKERIKELSLNPRVDKTQNMMPEASPAEQAAEQPVQLKEIEGISPDDHIRGTADAEIRMILYSDLACEYCAEFKETLDTILQEYSGEMVLAFRHFPSLSDPASMEAALAAECAAEQDEFWAMYDKLYEDNLENTLSYEEYLKDAEELDLDLARFSECYSRQTHKSKIMDQYLKGRNYYVTGTPTFFLNRDIYVGSYPLDDFIRSDGEEVMGMRNLIQSYLSE